MIFINLTFVKLVKFHIYKKSIEFVVDFTTFSLSENRYKINNNLEFNDVISNRREYKIMLFILL